MFTLAEPSDQDIERFLSSQLGLPFSYAEVGSTRPVVANQHNLDAGRSNPAGQFVAPPGYTLDHNRVQLGRGADVFQKAVDALKQWRQFELGWVTIVPRGVKLETSAIVAVKAWACGLWSLNACRVIYVIDEREPMRRFGFAYGTLADHVERGEERFLIEWDQRDERVWYDILAFSRPRHPLVRAGFPVARMLQKRFAKDSLAVMKSVVDSV